LAIEHADDRCFHRKRTLGDKDVGVHEIISNWAHVVECSARKCAKILHDPKNRTVQEWCALGHDDELIGAVAIEVVGDRDLGGELQSAAINVGVHRMTRDRRHVLPSAIRKPADIFHHPQIVASRT
jgi:hypothetical protein